LKIDHYLSETFFYSLFFLFKFLYIRLTFRHIPDQLPLIIHRQTIPSTLNTRRVSIPLDQSLTSDTKRDIDESSLQQSLSICPLCEISFDTIGIHRPVNDACGHTTCFQCFKAVMIKATGCSLCQKEEEINYSVRKIFID
jgi:hypothetical protein